MSPALIFKCAASATVFIGVYFDNTVRCFAAPNPATALSRNHMTNQSGLNLASGTAEHPSFMSSTQLKPAPAGARQTWIRALVALKRMEDSPDLTFAAMLDGLAEEHGARPALLGADEGLTHGALAARVNQIARWALAREIGADGPVALLMPNCPAYVALWLGLTRAGRTVALLNNNLTGEALRHCITAAGARDLIADPAGLAGAAPRLWDPQDEAIAAQSPLPLSGAECPFPRPSDVALLVYTSGTTGLPKAAKITHARILEWSLWFAGMMDATPEDRLYDCLPLYHSTGGIVAIGAMLVSGGSVLIAPRFSASRFWDDVTDGGCTIFQYIGELCRYLTATPPHPRERAHKLRLACGNGLQGGVWESFQDRFAIPRILEFYAATEGNVSLYNCEGKPGAIGRIPPFLTARFPAAVIRCDPETGIPVRGADGFCEACGADEPGEAIGRIDPDPVRQFDGYTDAAASAKKILRGVFADGDAWFRTGDLMRRDTAGFWYFVDRLGDTFRWKGENVSTTEVAALLRGCDGVRDAVVYGVAVPGHEGRAGMTALTMADGFCWSVFHAHVQMVLPDYARPVFVRVCPALDVTGTFKLTKGGLLTEGFAGSADPVWLLDRAAGCYVPCDATLIGAIGSGRLRI